jgi:hypothetical protein
MTNAVANACVSLCRQGEVPRGQGATRISGYRASDQCTRTIWARGAEQESHMSYSDPRYRGDEGESGVRYRAGSFQRIPLAPHQMQFLYGYKAAASGAERRKQVQSPV